VAGEETRICRHNPAHVDQREIPALSTDHTVTIYFRCTGNGGGETNYPGQITEIATRSGTGSGDMTIKLNWDQWTSPKSFDVDGLGASTFTTSSSGNYNGAEQTLTISNITSDLTSPIVPSVGTAKPTSKPTSIVLLLVFLLCQVLRVSDRREYTYPTFNPSLLPISTAISSMRRTCGYNLEQRLLPMSPKWYLVAWQMMEGI
jgi:hypothetical protein